MSCTPVSWIAGLAIGAPSPRLNASGQQIAREFAGHSGAVATQFALTEGLPALGLVVVSLSLARAASDAGKVAAARCAAVAGVAAAAISLTQFVLGELLARGPSAGVAQQLYEAVNRADGIKMFSLALLGTAGVASGLLPRWLRYVAIALAGTIVASGVAYLLLMPSLAALAYVPGLLLLIFITGTAITSL